MALPAKQGVAATIDADGTTTIVVDNGNNQDGSVAQDRWRGKPEHLAKMVDAMIANSGPWNGLRPGDVTAMKDAAAQAAKDAAG